MPIIQSNNDNGDSDYSPVQEKSTPLKVWSFHSFKIVDITKQDSISNINDSVYYIKFYKTITGKFRIIKLIFELEDTNIYIYKQLNEILKEVKWLIESKT